MSTTENLTAGTTAVRIQLLSCGHVEWRAAVVANVYAGPYHCLACQRSVTVVHYLDEQVTDADEGAAERFHVSAVQDWGGTQEHWKVWDGHFTRAEAETIGIDMLIADSAIREGTPEWYCRVERKYSAVYGERWHDLVSGNVAPGWDAVFIDSCEDKDQPTAPWWKAGQDIPAKDADTPDPWAIPAGQG